MIYMPPNQYINRVLENNKNSKSVFFNCVKHWYSILEGKNQAKAYPKIGAENMWVTSGHKKDAFNTYAK